MSSHSDIKFDYNYVLADQVGVENGLGLKEIEELFPAVTQIQKALYDLKKLGQLPFQELPYQEEVAEKIIEEAKRVQKAYDDIVVLGIGGSGLGPACLNETIGPQNEKKLHVIDNVDPIVWQRLTDKVQIKKTLFVVISKSGKTVETLAAFSYFREKLIKYLGQTGYRRNLVIITDPKSGPLNEIARHENIVSFHIPRALGGRYSVLSPVGLFPAACIGIDIQALLAGARQMDRRCQETDLWNNPATMSGLIHYLLATQKKKTIRILMPYSELLETYTEWFCQLWAESLGKRFNLKGEMLDAGQTPVRAMGATDQHSQLQLYLEGPRDKVISFFNIKEGPSDTIPESYSHCTELEILSGQTVRSLLEIEYRATEQALRKEGIPSLSIMLPRPDAFSLGQLFYLAEMETVVAGELYNINPFDQPAVESIKKYIKGLLGMEGFEEYKKEIETSPKNERYII